MQAQVGSQSISSGVTGCGSPAVGAMPCARSEHSAEPSVCPSTDSSCVQICTRSGPQWAGSEQRVLWARRGSPGRGSGVCPANCPGRRELANRAGQAFCGQACEGSYPVNWIAAQRQGPWEPSLPLFLAGKLEQGCVCDSRRGWLCKYHSPDS